MQDDKIIEKVLEQNKKGLKRLADDKPAAERRSKLKKIEKKIKDLFQNEKKVGRITT